MIVSARGARSWSQGRTIFRRLAQRPYLVIGLIALGALVLYLLIAFGGFRFQRTGMDLGIFDQAVKAYSHFQIPYIPIKAQAPFNILGDHFSPVIALLAPLYWLWPNARVLLCAQAVLFALSVWIVGRYAWRRGLGRMAFAVEAGFAVSYGVLSAAAYDFHEVAFGLPILLWALWALLEKHDGQLVIACIAMVFVKEDMPMYIAGIALVLFFTGRRLFGVILGAASVAVTILLIYVVIPYFSYWGHYAYIGSGARGLRSISGMALSMGDHLLSVKGIGFLLLILVTAGLGLKSKIMLVVIPTVVFRFMANDSVYLSFYFHYGVLLTGVLFMAMIDGWQRWKGRWINRRRLVSLQKWLLGIGAVAGLIASMSLMSLYGLAGHSDMIDNREAVESLIPDGANVAADVYLVNDLVDRTTVQVAYPTWKDETGAPITSDWVLLDIQSRAFYNSTDPWVEPLINQLTSSGQYIVVDQVRRYVLLERTG